MSLNVTMEVVYHVKYQGIEKSGRPHAVAYARGYIVSNPGKRSIPA